MKKLFWVLMLLIAMIAVQGSEFYDEFDILQSARLEGGAHSFYYTAGADTITCALLVDSTGFDTIAYTDWVQIGWIADSTTAVDGKTYDISNRIVYHGADIFQLWVMLDSCTIDTAAWNGSDTTYGSYTDGDSVALSSARVEFLLLSDDVDSSYSGWFADSSNVFLKDGGYTASYYGEWVYEDLVYAIATDGVVNRWRVYNVRIPIAAYARVVFESSNTVLETSVIRWRLVCARSGG